MLKTVLLTLALPPANLALLAAVALPFHRGRAGLVVPVLALAALVLLSLPVVADSMLAALDTPAPGAPAASPVAAIIVLGAEVEQDAAPPHPTIPGPLTLERLRAAAALERRTGLPVLVSGGYVLDGADPAAVAMAHSLTADFALPPRWVEDASATTWQNARNSAAMLLPQGVRTAYVVTHGWHMRRALLAFAATGLQVVPVPVRHDPWPRLRLAEFMPQAGAWHRSYYAVHEWLGCAVYALRLRRARS